MTPLDTPATVVPTVTASVAGPATVPDAVPGAAARGLHRSRLVLSLLPLLPLPRLPARNGDRVTGKLSCGNELLNLFP